MVLPLLEKKIQLSTKKIQYKEWIVDFIYNPKLKHSYIKIDSCSTIIVKSPQKSIEFVLELLKERESWVQKQLTNISHVTLLNYNLEDEVLLFGERYSIDADEAFFLRNKLLRLKKSDEQYVLNCYDAYYKNICQTYLTHRVEYFAEMMNLKYSALQYRKMRGRWGSCSSKGVITLNSELPKIRKELIDYVVVHELSHRVHMNHSQAFHSLVESHLPNSKALRKELKNIRLL